jgi:hypothetical protein
LVSLNDTSNLISGACPFLENFDLSGTMYGFASGYAVSLHFVHDNPFLKYISVNMYTDYYTLSVIPERKVKHYKDFETLQTRKYTSKQFFIDLT